MAFGFCWGVCVLFYWVQIVFCHVVFFGLIMMCFTLYGMCCGVVLVLFLGHMV